MADFEREHAIQRIFTRNVGWVDLISLVTITYPFIK